MPDSLASSLSSLPRRAMPLRKPSGSSPSYSNRGDAMLIRCMGSKLAAASAPATTERVPSGYDSAELGDGELAVLPRPGLRPLGSFERRQVGDDDVDGAFAALEAAAGAEQGGGADEGPVALVDGWGDDEVDRAALILQEHEGDAVGGLGALAGGDHAGDLDRGAVVEAGEV